MPENAFCFLTADADSGLDAGFSCEEYDGEKQINQQKV